MDSAPILLVRDLLASNAAVFTDRSPADRLPLRDLSLLLNPMFLGTREPPVVVVGRERTGSVVGDLRFHANAEVLRNRRGDQIAAGSLEVTVGTEGNILPVCLESKFDSRFTATVNDHTTLLMGRDCAHGLRKSGS